MWRIQVIRTTWQSAWVVVAACCLISCSTLGEPQTPEKVIAGNYARIEQLALEVDAMLLDGSISVEQAATLSDALEAAKAATDLARTAMASNDVDKTTSLLNNAIFLLTQLETQLKDRSQR
jgi:hypothetical protein